MYLNKMFNAITVILTIINDLEIEKGRYKNIKSDKRICKNCQTLEKEDEFHFLIRCPKYLTERECLFTYISKYCFNFNLLSDQNKFVWLMTTEDINIIQNWQIIFTHALK